MSQTEGSNPDQYNSTAGPSEGPEDTTTSDRGRRRFLVAVTAATGVIGAGFAAVPFLNSLRPSAKAQALGGPVRVNLSQLVPGEQITVMWRGKPVWVLKRTAAMLDRLSHVHLLQELRDPDSAIDTQQPGYAQNPTRSIRPDYLVVVALCTHLGCVPTFKPVVADPTLGENWMGGYFCPCHGSRFDLAGRVTKNVPAPTNLVVPPHRFLGADTLEIGVDHA